MSNVTFRIDDNLKNESQQILDQLGLTMNTAFNIFLHQLCIDKGFPFRPSIDPFYSTANQTYLEKSVRQFEEGHTVTKTMAELEAMEDE